MTTNANPSIIAKMFKGLFIAQVFATIASGLGSIINGLIIGNFMDPESLVPLALATPLTLFLTAIGSIISNGARIVCGRYMGRGELDKLNKVFTLSMVILFACGGVFTLVLLAFANNLASLFGATGSAIALTAAYLRGLAVGVIPMLLIPSLMIFLQMNNDSKYVLISTFVLAIATLVCSVLNVFVFKAGMFGMGIANSIAQYVALAVIIFRFIKSPSLTKLEKFKYDSALVKDILLYGFPSAFCNILYPVRNMIINKMAFGVGGNDLVSALAIFSSGSNVIDAINISFNSVVVMLFSVFAGERDSHSIHSFAKYAIKFGLIINTIKNVAFFFLARPYSILFGAKGDVIGVSTMFLCIYICAAWPNIFSIVFSDIHQTFGRTLYINIVNIFSCLVFPIGFIFFTKGFAGNYSIYLCYFFAEIPTILIHLVNSWIKKKKVTFKLSELLDLPEDFEPENRYSKTISTLDEAINVSKELEEFCQSNGIEHKRSMYCGLCTEEMAVNVIEHGFAKAKGKDCSIDIFATCEDDTISVRLRDDSVPFDPRTRLTPFDKNDPTKSIGIRMVHNLAKEMNYQSTFGMNIMSFKL